MRTEAEPIYLTVDETAVLLRTTPKAVRRMLENGYLADAVRRIGRRVLLSRSAVIAFVESSASSSARR